MKSLRRRASNNLGVALLAIWLILQGIIPIISLSFAGLDLLLGLLAIAAGVLLLLGR
ncbi:MAG: hypothetical protein JW910_01840 [Anaerolineae bacterium]|nr:hypothetical protein [Anaerolineae bacterium]